MRCVLVILALVAAINADPDQPCSKQMELEKRCMLTIETSPEATMIRERKKQVMKTCVPDMPQECHAEYEAAHDCVVSIAKNADTDELFTQSKSKSQPAIDECIAKNPPNVKQGFAEIFMMSKPPPRPHFKKWRRHDRNQTESGENTSGESGEVSSSAESGESSSNETDSGSFERRRHHGGGHGGGGGGGRHHGGGGRHHGGGGGGRHHGGGGRGGHGRHCHGGGGRGGRGGRGGHGRHHHGGHGRHHGPRNFTSGEAMDSNETSSSSSSSAESGGVSGGRSGGRSGGKSWEKKRMPEQCRKTPEQFKCIREEFKKLGEDKSVINIMNTLIRQKKKCKQIVDWSCSAKCPKRQRCIWKASQPCREAFMTRMKTCMENKGFTLPPFMRGADAFTTPVPVIDQ